MKRNRWKDEGMKEFLDFLAERGFSVQVPKQVLEDAISEWLNSWNPSYIAQYRRALIRAGFLKPRASGRVYDIIKKEAKENDGVPDRA